MSIGTIILIILIIALLGGFSGIGGGPFYGTGYYGGGGPRRVILLLLLPVFLLRVLVFSDAHLLRGGTGPLSPRPPRHVCTLRRDGGLASLSPPYFFSSRFIAALIDDAASS